MTLSPSCWILVSFALLECSHLCLRHVVPSAPQSAPHPTIPFLGRLVQTLLIFSVQLDNYLLCTYDTAPLSQHQFLSFLCLQKALFTPLLEQIS